MLATLDSVLLGLGAHAGAGGAIGSVAAFVIASIYQDVTGRSVEISDWVGRGAGLGGVFGLAVYIFGR